MNTKRCVGSISIIILMALPGCGLDFWERHATPQSQYGRERAELLCHPFNDCTQGTWQADENIAGDLKEAYAQCTERAPFFREFARQANAALQGLAQQQGFQQVHSLAALAQDLLRGFAPLGRLHPILPAIQG